LFLAAFRLRADFLGLGISEEGTMGLIGRLSVLVAVLSVVACGIGHSPAQAGEVLVNGNLDTGVAPPGWTITTSITGIPGSEIPQVYEHTDGANNPPPPSPGLGILLHPQKGDQGDYDGQHLAINFVLQQTFASAVAGHTYVFAADALVQDGFSGIVDTLTANHPVGDYNDDFAVNAADYTTWRDAMTAGSSTLPNRDPSKSNDVDPVGEDDFTFWRDNYGDLGQAGSASPTQAKFEMDFLDINSAVIGSPVVYNLRDDPVTLEWVTHSLMGVAPTGTKKVQIKFSASDMVDNCCAMGQDVLLDNFSLKDQNSAPTLNRLSNGGLDTPGAPIGWTLTTGPTVDQGGGPVVAASAQYIDFANRQVAGGANPNPPPDFLSVRTGPQGLWLKPFVNTTQFEPDIPDDFASLSQVVPGTPGASYQFSAWAAWEAGYCGGLLGTTTDTYMKMEFLDGSMGVLSTLTLHLAEDGQVNDDAGNTEYDDWMQHFLNGVAPLGTANVRVSVGATGMFDSGFNPQSGFFDEMSLIETLPGGAGSGAAAVPEPGSTLLLAFGGVLGMFGFGRRRG
jgi:hypothetical protein